MDDRIGVFVMLEALRALGDHEATIFAVATSQEEVGLRGAAASGSALEPTVVVALDMTLAVDVPGGGNENEITALGKGVALKIMDGYSISHPKLVEHFRTIAEREGIPHQMEILPFGGTDAGGVQRLHGGIPAITLSIPCRYVHTPNEMVNAVGRPGRHRPPRPLPRRGPHRRLRALVPSPAARRAFRETPLRAAVYFPRRAAYNGGVSCGGIDRVRGTIRWLEGREGKAWGGMRCI